jgi:hypothetical protein
MNVETILTTVLASSASASVVVFLSKSLLKLWLDKDLETHRANLARESAAEVEKLRAQLAQVALEHEVRFKRMHERRTAIIATIFAHLERLHASVRRWSERQALLPKDDAVVRAAAAGAFAAEARTAMEKLEAFYYPRAIWLERDLCDQLNHVIGALGLLLTVLQGEAVGVPVQIEGQDRTTELTTELLALVASARAALEARFRGILGIAES